MEQRQVILCKQCFYFSTKSEQQRHQSIHFLQNRIEWQCEACGYQNIYQKGEEVEQPCNNLLLLRKSNLLDNLYGENQSNYLFLIDCKDLKNKVLYLTFHERKIVQEAIETKMPNLKTIEELKNESQWLNIFENKCKAIQKFASQKIERKAIRCLEEVVYQVQKCIKLIIARSSSKNVSQSFYIKVMNDSEVYNFTFSSNTMKNSTEIESFLLILAIIDCETIFNSHKWLKNIYKQDLAKYSNYSAVSIKIRQMVVFSSNNITKKKHFESILSQMLAIKDYNELVEEQRIVIIAIDNIQQKANTFQMHPLHQRYLFKRNDSTQGQISNILPNPKTISYLLIFYSNNCDSDQILRYVGSSKESQLVLQLLYNFQTNSSAEVQIFKNQLEVMLKSRNIQQAHILRLCLQIQIKNEIRIILYTFDQKQYKQKSRYDYPDEVIKQQHLSINRYDDVQALTAEDFSPFFARYNHAENIDCQILKISDEDYICL